MSILVQRPSDEEAWDEWLLRRTREENNWVTFAFFINNELVCTRESLIQTAADFRTLCESSADHIKVVGEKRDGSSLTLGLRVPGSGAIAGTPWFLRAAKV